ncbi:putative nucleotidyltransferase [Frondihabitans sp. PhB188]|uniref:helix-turn-helix domain-containing protein n=1 Tax=Frondihabitans sp. PhB188 TaxID=2485200 RepID=UPI000F47BA30|nr:XRE family transcriptional regulator [Frondihabitans sp. PhB188]ROQ40121.1 putative nucleotidyltransferase [Frondihabitans sp. PhB188]
MTPPNAALLIRRAREDIGQSQSELAASAGIQQPTISAYESGSKRPRPETLAKILRAARLRPSVALHVLADDVRSAAAAHGLADVRVFGSVLDGTDTEDSDIDLLVRTTAATTLFDLGAFGAAVESLTGFHADVLTDSQAEATFLRHVRERAERL